MFTPRSTAELSEQAVVSVEPNLSIRLYFRSAELLLRQARIYQLENDLERAYVQYMKYTNLGLIELAKHPDYKKHENKSAIRSLHNKCFEVLDIMESIKPVLNQRYHDYQEKSKKATTERQYQSVMPHKQKDNKETQPVVQTEWNLQEALRGVAGVGSNEDRTSAPNRYTPSIQYPNHSFHNQSDGYDYHRMKPSAPPHSSTYDIPPQLPPKTHYVPTLPPKVPIRPELPPKIKIEPTGPTTDASTERGEPLRRMLLPQGMQTRFLSIAESNTKNKIETCGILAGILKNNVLKITTLIIPKQTGTSDTCTTENEEELFDIQDKHDLLTFGWIHTHPTQSCFLSSVDLHTHCSYQLMLPEAIAIVCAPSHKPNFGVFRLTDPPGLDVISECKQTPAFHPHPDLPIYTTAQEGEGHIQILDYPFDVLDLRK